MQYKTRGIGPFLPKKMKYVRNKKYKMPRRICRLYLLVNNNNSTVFYSDINRLIVCCRSFFPLRTHLQDRQKQQQKNLETDLIVLKI